MYTALRSPVAANSLILDWSLPPVAAVLPKLGASLQLEMEAVSVGGYGFMGVIILLRFCGVIFLSIKPGIASAVDNLGLDGYWLCTISGDVGAGKLCVI